MCPVHLSRLLISHIFRCWIERMSQYQNSAAPPVGSSLVSCRGGQMRQNTIFMAAILLFFQCSYPRGSVSISSRQWQWSSKAIYILNLSVCRWIGWIPIISVHNLALPQGKASVLTSPTSLSNPCSLSSSRGWDSSRNSSLRWVMSALSGDLRSLMLSLYYCVCGSLFCSFVISINDWWPSWMCS